jgi:hypothetical protein
MYRKIATLVGPLLLATLALPAFVAPQALAAPPQTAAITAHLLFVDQPGSGSGGGGSGGPGSGTGGGGGGGGGGHTKS